MLYRFLCPRLDGSVIDVAIEADDLQAAVDDFADNHWQTEMSGTFAVWSGQRLAARVMPCWNAACGEVRPMYQEFDPPRPQSLACGD
jgi:hypothetical protein